MRGNDAARYEAHLVGYGLKGRLANRCLGPVPGYGWGWEYDHGTGNHTELQT